MAPKNGRDDPFRSENDFPGLWLSIIILMALSFDSGNFYVMLLQRKMCYIRPEKKRQRRNKKGRPSVPDMSKDPGSPWSGEFPRYYFIVSKRTETEKTVSAILHAILIHLLKPFLRFIILAATGKEGQVCLMMKSCL